MVRKRRRATRATRRRPRPQRGGRDQHGDRRDSQSRLENHQRVGKVSRKECQKSSFKTHGREPKGKTKTQCRRILHLQHHVSIKREESGEKEKKPILGDE